MVSMLRRMCYVGVGNWSKICKCIFDYCIMFHYYQVGLKSQSTTLLIDVCYVCYYTVSLN